MMQGAGKKLFSRSTLTHEEHGRVRRCGTLYRPAYLFESRVVTNDLWKPVPGGILLSENEVFHQQTSLFDGALGQNHEMIGIDRFRKEIERAVFHGGHGILDRSKGRHDDDGQVRVRLPRRLQHVHTAPPR